MWNMSTQSQGVWNVRVVVSMSLGSIDEFRLKHARDQESERCSNRETLPVGHRAGERIAIPQERMRAGRDALN